MDYLHERLSLHSGDTVEVQLDHQANVLLLSEANYQRYRRGERYEYYGGLARKSPLHLVPPRAGQWHLVVDLGGRSGTIRASSRILSG